MRKSKNKRHIHIWLVMLSFVVLLTQQAASVLPMASAEEAFETFETFEAVEDENDNVQSYEGFNEENDGESYVEDDSAAYDGFEEVPSAEDDYSEDVPPTAESYEEIPADETPVQEDSFEETGFVPSGNDDFELVQTGEQNTAQEDLPSVQETEIVQTDTAVPVAVIHEETDIWQDPAVESTQTETQPVSAEEHTVSFGGDTVVDTLVKICVIHKGVGTPLSGARMQLLDGEKNPVKEWVSSEAAFEVTGLMTEKKYIIHEISAPEGYFPSQDVELWLDEDGKVDSTLTTAKGVKGEDATILIENRAKDEAASLTVNKFLKLADEETGEEIDYVSEEDLTFYVALFGSIDEDGCPTDMLEGSQKAITFSGTSLESVTYDNLDPGSVVYLAEVKEDGSYYDLRPNEQDYFVPSYLLYDALCEEIEIEEGENEFDLTNYYGMLIPGDDLTCTLSLTKKVLSQDGEEIACDDVFYAGIFEDAEHTILASDTLVEKNIVEFAMDGESSVTTDIEVYLSEENSTAELYVTETDEAGTPFVPDMYELDVDADSVVFDLEEEETQKEMILSNTLLSGEVNEEITGSLIVRKNLVMIDDDGELEMNEPIAARDVSFYVALFTDAELTEPVENSVHEISYDNQDSSSTIYDNLSEGTYYLAEVNKDGQPISGDDLEGMVYFPSYELDGESIEVNISAGETEEAEFENIFFDLPENFFFSLELDVTLGLYNSEEKPLASNDTFYAGIFRIDEDGELVLANEGVADEDKKVLDDILTFDLGGNSETTVSMLIATTLEELEEGVTYYILETDETGTLVGDDFAYQVDISEEGEVFFNTENLNQSVTIKNIALPVPTTTPVPVTATPTPTPVITFWPVFTPTPGSGTVVTAVTVAPNTAQTQNVTTNTTGTTNTTVPVRTADDSRTGLYVLILCAAAGTILILGRIRRTR